MTFDDLMERQEAIEEILCGIDCNQEEAADLAEFFSRIKLMMDSFMETAKDYNPYFRQKWLYN